MIPSRCAAQMCIAALTYSAPWGRAEFFVTRELVELRKRCRRLYVFPLTPCGDLFHAQGRDLVVGSYAFPLVSFPMLLQLFRFTIAHFNKFASLLFVLLANRSSVRVLLSNLAVLPKSVYLSYIFRRLQVTHIFVNWATTPATMAYIISRLCGIPWILRTHRWDIYQNNMLTQKLDSARFVLCVSGETKRALLAIGGQQYANKVVVKPIGFSCDPLDAQSIRQRIIGRRHQSRFHIVTPANLVAVKGHRFLLSACSQLIRKGTSDFHLSLYGDGPLHADIQRQIDHLALSSVVSLYPSIPNDQLLGLYRDNQVDLLVLPSIVTAEGEHEGLPTVLIEAMACGVPVISTATGGIPELLADGCGLVVEPESPAALADAIEHIIDDCQHAIQLAVCGYQRISSKYDMDTTIEWIISAMSIGSISVDTRCAGE